MSKCPACGSENASDSLSCTKCGQTLQGPESLVTGIVCPNCDTFNTLDSQRCVRCGRPLDEVNAHSTTPEIKAAAAPEITQVDPRPPFAVSPQPSPPRPGKRATDSLPAAVAPAKPASRCPHCKSLLPAGAQTCPVCTRPLGSQSAQSPTQPPLEMSVRLRLCRGFGREDATYPIGAAGVTIGRGPAVIEIKEDPYLSPVHAAVLLREGKLLLEDRGSLNGTFLRVRGKAALQQGAEFIIGHQRLLLVGFGGPTTDPRIVNRSDSRASGSPVVRQLFVALRSIHAGADGRALAGPVILRAGPVVSIGVEGCQINFPGDSRLASRHAELHLRPGGIELVVTGPTGAFVRVKKTTPLQNGDEILLGEEIFRLEMN